MTDTAQPNAEQPTGNNANDRAGGEQATPEAKFTQDDLNFFLGKEKADLQRSLQNKYGDLDTLAEKAAQLDALKQAEMTETERLKQALVDKDNEIALARQEAEQARLNALRLRVGQEVGLPSVLAARLQGADEEAIKADAEAVKAVLGDGAQPPTIPNINATAGGNQTGSSRSTIKLTAQQRAIADMYKMSYEDYAKSLQQFEE